MKKLSEKTKLNTCIIIPVFNEAKVIGGVIEKLKRLNATIICVNDGSTDNSDQEILKTSALLINHPINLGQGAAIQTGIEFALKLQPKVKYFATFDGDGQHDVENLKAMLSYLQNQQSDIVLGSRFLDSANTQPIPILKEIVLKLGVIYSNAICNISLTDTHNGLRVFNKHVAQTIDIRQSGMAHASEIISKIAVNNYSYGEYPVTISYDSYAKSKGQTIWNSINIAFDMMLDRILYR